MLKIEADHKSASKSRVARERRALAYNSGSIFKFATHSYTILLVNLRDVQAFPGTFLCLTSCLSLTFVQNHRGYYVLPLVDRSPQSPCLFTPGYFRCQAPVLCGPFPPSDLLGIIIYLHQRHALVERLLSVLYSLVQSPNQPLHPM